MILNSVSILLSVFLIGSISCQATWPTFWFYRKSAPNTGIQVTASNVMSTSGFDRTKNVVLLIHGFGSSKESPSIAKLRQAFLASTDLNVISVDWEGGATSPNYLGAKTNTKTVGAKTADFLRTAGISGSKVHCVGHSLGAHTCGFTGKNYKLSRISGLDPAGPLFQGVATTERLATTDADFTDCLHTDSGLGIQEAICHKNYYPNGGAFQVGCPTVGKRQVEVDPKLKEYDPLQYELDTQVYHLRLTPESDDTDYVGCSHNRAPSYFAESVGKCGFTSTPCTSHQNFLDNKCKCSTQYGCCSMGYCSPRMPDHGRFHLETLPSPPYSKN